MGAQILLTPSTFCSVVALAIASVVISSSNDLPSLPPLLQAVLLGVGILLALVVSDCGVDIEDTPSGDGTTLAVVRIPLVLVPEVVGGERG